MVVGITGGIGSGKSTVTAIFRELENVQVYIADEEAKKLMNSSETIRKQLISEFGENTYLNQELNRAYLADKVFKDPSNLAKLNVIVHPVVHQHFAEFQNRHQEAIIVYENAILFEIGSDRFCDVIISVFAPENERISRVMKRDGISKSQVLDRMKHQWKDSRKILLSNYLIINNELEALHSQVQQIHNILTEKMNSV